MHELTLGLGDVFTIGNVEVKVVDVQPDRVRLGITAPRYIPVHRKEIYLAIQRDRAARPPETPNPTKEPQ